MSIRKTLLLTFLLGALLIYIAKVELVKDEDKRAAERPLENIAAVALEEIEISNAKGAFALVNAEPKAPAKNPEAGDQTLSTEESSKWSIKGIKDSRLDRGALNALIAAVRGVALENALPPEETEQDLSVYGLSKPELVVGVRGKNAAGALIEHTYELGKLNEYVSKRYLKDAAQRSVYLAPNDLYVAVNKEASELRNPTPLSLEIIATQRLTVTPKVGAGFSLEQHEGVWRIANPGPFSASQSSVEDILREIRNLKVTRFIDNAGDSLQPYGLQAPVLRIDAEPKDKSTGETLQISFGQVAEASASSAGKGGESKPRYFMSIRGQAPVFEIGVDPLARIVRPLKDIRDRKPVKLDSDRISEARITVSGREEIVLGRDGAGWTVNTKPADAPFVMEFFNSVTALEALDFAESARTIDPQKLSAKLSFVLGSAPAAERLVLSLQADSSSARDRYLAIVEGQTEPFIISAESFKKITPRLEALLKSEAAPEVTTPTGK